MPELVVGRYALHRQIARGGMATIHIARLLGDVGFSRIVAAKRLKPELSEDPDFVAMFLDEARIASKLSHRNVVPVLDVVNTGGEIVLVQEYVHGAPLHWLLGKARELGQYVPADIAVSIACQVLAGLHAAHEMVDELGTPLHIVHRDVSPQNVMIAVDGTARLLDFGIAKAAIAAHVTRAGTYKGKLAYSAPEQLRGNACKQSDIFSLSVMLWEVIVGHRMHADQSDTEVISTVLAGNWPTICEALAIGCDTAMISDEAWSRWQGVDAVVQKGLAVNVADRWQSAADMEAALYDVVTPASSRAVARWLEGIGKTFLEKQDRILAAEEASWRQRGPLAMGTASDGGTTAGSGAEGRRGWSDGGTTAGSGAEGRRGWSDGGTTAGSGAEGRRGWSDGPLPEPYVAVPETIMHPPSRPVSIPPAPRIRSPWTVILLAVMALGLGVALAVVSLRRDEPPDAPATSLEAPRALPAAVVKPSVIAPDARTVERTPLPVVHRPAPRPRPKAIPKPKTVAKPAKTPPACNPPYFFQGTKKVFRPECL